MDFLATEQQRPDPPPVHSRPAPQKMSHEKVKQKIKNAGFLPFVIPVE